MLGFRASGGGFRGRRSQRRGGFGAPGDGALIVTDLPATATAPTVYVIPSTIAEATAQVGLSFTDWVKCNLSSGNLVTDGGVTLAQEGSILYGRTVPAWNGTDFSSGYRAVEFLGTDVQAFAAASAATYSLSTSRCFVMALRLLRPPVANRGLIGNRSGTASTAAGFHVAVSAPDGAPVLTVCDGSTTATVNGPGITDQLDSIGNGAIHWIAIQITAANLATIYAYGMAGAPTAIPTGAKTSATVFRLGGQPFLYSCETLQVLALGVLSGAAADAFTLAHLNALDTGCKPPPGYVGHARAHVTAPIVGSDAGGVLVAHYAGSQVTTKSDFAHAYAPNCTGPGNVGCMVERSIAIDRLAATTYTMRNRLARTSNLADTEAWAHVNVAATANVGDDPGGFRGAARLTATAGGGRVTQDFTGENTEDHTVSVFAQRNQGTNVAARLSLYNSVGPVEIAGVDITITAARQRFYLTVPGATVGAVTTLQWRLTITNNGDSVFATFAGANFKWLTSYMPQAFTLKIRDDIHGWIDNTAARAFDVVGGRVEVTLTGFLPSINSSGCFAFATDNDDSAPPLYKDRAYFHVSALTNTPAHEHVIYDGDGNLAARTAIAAPTMTDEITYGMEWDSRRVLEGMAVRALVDVTVSGVTTRYLNDGAAYLPAVAPWTTGAAADRLFPGMRHTETAHYEGVWTEVRVWTRND